MALLYFDGFDGYDAPSDLINIGEWDAAAAPYDIITTTRSGSGKAIRLNAPSGYYARYNFGSNFYNSTIFVGGAIYLTTLANSGEVFSILTDVGSSAIHFGYSSTTNTFYLSTTSGYVFGTFEPAANVWYYLEFQVKPHTSTGDFIFKINGNTDMSITSGIVQAASVTSAQYVRFWATGNSYTYWDDIYICDATGSLNNTFLGDVRCALLYPNGDSSVQFTPNSGGTNYTQVDDVIGAPDDDTTYVSSSTTGHKDKYTLQDLSDAATVHGVKVITRAEKDDANPLSLKTGIEYSGTNQTNTRSLGEGYATVSDIYETSDGSTTAWTQTTVNAALSTIEVV